MMKIISIVNLTIISLLNLFIVVYVYIIGGASGNVPMSELVANIIFFIGLICGIISFVLLIILGRSNKILRVPFISLGLSILIIPHGFIISLIYFFGTNR